MTKQSALVAALALAPLLVALWVSPILPTHDGPKHLYAAHVWAHASDPAFSVEFTRDWPVTSAGFTLVYALLERVLSWRLAYGLTWTVIVLTLPLGLWLCARAMHAHRSAIGLIGVAGAVHWSVHMGFANYVASVGLGFVALGLGLGSDRWSVRRELGIYAVMLLGCVFHPVGAQFTAVALFAYRALSTSRGRVVRDLGATMLGCTPAVAITLISRDTLEDLRAQGLISASASLQLSARERIETLFACFLAGPVWRSGPVLLLAVLGVGAALVSLLRWRLDKRVVAMLSVVALGALGTSLAPMHSGAWEYMQPRFIPLAAFAAVLLVPFELLSARLRAIGTVGLLVFAVSSNLWVAREHARYAAINAAALSGLGAPSAPGRTLLPILATYENSYEYQQDRSRPIANAAPNLNLGQVYGVDRSAIVPYTFSFLPGIHPIASRRAAMPKVPKRDYGKFFQDGADPVVRRRELVRLGSFGTVFDDVLFVGAEDDARALEALGYEVALRREGFVLGHLVGCPLRVEVAGDVGAGALLIGWTPSDRIVAILPVGPDEPRTFEVPRGSCGGMWAKLAARPGERCAEATADDAVVAEPGASVLVCTPRL